jgi:hypothetical protein
MAISITGMRDRIKALSPSWLQDGTSERLMFNYGFALDAVLEKLTQGVLARFPTRAQPDANTATGADRLTQQGITESASSFARRLQRAIDAARFTGSSRGVLSQVLGYLLAMTPAVRTVSSSYDRSASPATRISTTWDSYPVGRSPDAEPVHLLVTTAAGNWDWDSLSQVSGSYGWWGSFLILDTEFPNNWARAATWRWGDLGLTWGTIPGSWGLDVEPGVVEAIRQIVTVQKGGHTWLREIIVSLDPTLFDSSQPAGGGVNPDGHFGRWSKIVGGVVVPARFANARYCGGAV